jgi:hypothetical protein
VCLNVCQPIRFVISALTAAGCTKSVRAESGQYGTTPFLPLVLPPFANHAFTQGQPADFVIGFSDTAINKLLVAHYVNNPDFYDRSREKHPDNPVFEYAFDDHESTRKLKLWAKVVQDNGKPAVTVELIDDSAVKSRFAAWWRCQYGANAMKGAGALPDNVRVSVPRVILQLNFPKLDGSGGENQVDLWISLTIYAYIKLDTAPNGDPELKLINFDIQSEPNDDPLDPKDPIWGKLKPGCEDVELSKQGPYPVDSAATDKCSERRMTTKQVRETEAEAVAFVVCQSVGLQNGTASQDYIQLWHGDANLLRESLEAVQQTAAVILGQCPISANLRN